MAGKARPVARGLLDLQAHAARAERQRINRALARQQTPTFPRLIDAPDDGVETQVAFFPVGTPGTPPSAYKPMYFEDGQWRDFAGASFTGETNEAVILATSPGAYYKLDETTGDWADSTGGGRTLSYVSETGTVRGAASSFDEEDGELCVTVDGGLPSAAHNDTNVGNRTDSFFRRAGTAAFTISARIKPHARPPGSFSMGICGTSQEDGNGWGLFMHRDGTPRGLLLFRREGEDARAADGSDVGLNVWSRITGVFTGAELQIYQGATLLDTTASTASIAAVVANDTFRVAAAGITEGIGGTWAPFDGEIDSLIFWTRALAPAEVGAIAAGADPDEDEHKVLTADGAGGSGWEYPTIETYVNGA